jgi:capsular polysaccharide biosynthesis protein
MNIDRTRRWGFIILFAGFLIGVPGILMLVAHQRYEATARIKPAVQNNDPAPGVYDPYFIQTEFEIIKSDNVLGKVIDTLHLDDAWGKRYNYGKLIPKPEAIGLLKQCLDLQPVRNTNLLDIGVVSEDPEEAAKMANAIAAAYIDQRNQDASKLPSGVHVVPAELIEAAQTPTVPVGADNPTGKILFVGGIFVILASIRLLWRAYFAAPDPAT